MRDKLKLELVKFEKGEYTVYTNKDYIVFDSRANVFPRCEVIENIVKCVNNHQALVNALKQILAKKDMKFTELEATPYNWEIAEAALLLAGGESE